MLIDRYCQDCDELRLEETRDKTSFSSILAIMHRLETGR